MERVTKAVTVFALSSVCEKSSKFSLFSVVVSYPFSAAGVSLDPSAGLAFRCPFLTQRGESPSSSLSPRPMPRSPLQQL